MKDRKLFISEYSLFTSIVTCIMGVSIFSQARGLAKEVGTLSWLVILISGALACGCAFLIYFVVKNNNYQTVDVIFENSFGKVLGKILLVLFCLGTLYSLASGLRAFVEAIKVFMLPKTPINILCVFVILAGIYLVKGGLRTLLHFNSIAFWIMFIPVIAMFFSLNHADLTNNLPLIPVGDFNLLKGINVSIFSFAGFEILFFILPYMLKEQKVGRGIRNSFILVSIVYSVTIILTIALFSIKETERLLWPTLTVIKSINIPGTFLERWEGLVMVFWIIFYYTTFINFYFLACDILRNTFHLKEARLTTIFTSSIIYIFAMYPQSISEVKFSEDIIVPIVSYIFLIIIPAILFFISIIKKKKVKSQ